MFCEQCGAPRPAEARFCPSCGRVLTTEAVPPAEEKPPAATRAWNLDRLPHWLTGDWALVGLCLVLSLALLFAAATVYGVVVTVATAGSAKAIPDGAAMGAHLAFSALAAQTAARTSGDYGAGLGTQFLLLPWALVAPAAIFGGLRFAWPRLTTERTRVIAFAVKVALGFGLAIGIIAGIASTGDPDGSSGFGSEVDGGEAWFYGTIIAAITVAVVLRRRRVRVLPPAPPGVRRTGAVALHGAKAFAVLAGGLAVVAFVWALVVVDGGHERLAVLFGFPVIAGSAGAVVADVAMGAAAATARGHVSLAHFGLPADAGAGGAPAPLFLLLLAAPALVAAFTWRHLDRERPTDEQSTLGAGFAIGAGFAATAWVAALVGRVLLFVFVGRGGGLGSSVGTLLVARPNPASVLGLGLVWGLAGGLGAAWLWARRHSIAWRPPTPPAPPPAE